MSESKEEKREQISGTTITNITTINNNGSTGGENLLVKLLGKQLFSCADQDRTVYSVRTKEWICRRCTMENDGWAGQCHVCEGFHDESDGEMWTNVEELQEIKNIQARMVLSDTDSVLKDKMVLFLFGKSFSVSSSNLFR